MTSSFFVLKQVLVFGLKAGRSEKPFLVQTYRRNMGGGNFALMKDASGPIYVKGRHWGGIRCGYKI